MKKLYLLLALIIFSGTFVSSCSKKEDAPLSAPKEAQAAENADNDAINEEAEAATEKIMPDVPDDKNYGGYEFTILANSVAYNSHWYSRDIYVEGETGDTINDAVYYRNRAVEEKYNIKIGGVFSANQYNDARKSISAGDNTYDAFTIPMQGATAQLAQTGMLLDLKNVPYIDLEKPWWDQKANRQLSIGSKLMFTISDLLIIDKDALFIYLFNKDIIKESGLEDPYKLVREGKWTIEKMWDMAKLVTQDLNGDGVMDDGDRYGLIS